jgi:hypothetical protein
MAESTIMAVSERRPGASADVRETMRFKNGDVSLDVAVESIIKSGRKFTMPNSDLLVGAVRDTPW